MVTTTIMTGGLRASYSTHAPKRIKGTFLKLPNHRQRDVHSCGFVAALTVIEYFWPSVDQGDVLKAVRPLVDWGVGRVGLRRAIARFNIKVDHRRVLRVSDLRRFVGQGIPVIVSVWPGEWLNDHWVVVQGFAGDRIYFANHRSMTIKQFRREWSSFDMQGRGVNGEGFVCTRR